jgi:hypothetical protein
VVDERTMGECLDFALVVDGMRIDRITQVDEVVLGGDVPSICQRTLTSWWNALSRASNLMVQKRNFSDRNLWRCDLWHQIKD